MSYLGNSPGVSSQRVVTTFNVATSTTVFTPTSGYSLGYLDVYLNGVKLILGDDYTATNGTTFTLASAAVSGDVVEAVSYTPRGLSDGYTKAEADAKYPVKPTGTPNGSKFLRDDNSWQTVTAPSPTAVSDQANTSTGYFDLPHGTTAQRPASPSIGFTRFNTDLIAVETYHGSAKGWVYLSNVLQTTGGVVTEAAGYRYHTFNGSGTFTVQGGTGVVDYLIVAGGGGGATDSDVGGGGGAGGLITGSLTVTPQNYSIVVGAGGTGGTNAYTPGTGGGSNGAQGGPSSAFGLTAIGGGYGGTRSQAGGSGGSGGGGGDASGTGGAGTSGQGYAGGNAPAINSNGGWDQGGGGGAGGAASSYNPGPGVTSSISGSSVTYAAGGRGMGPATAAANTGNGGRGAATTADATGGSGIVIIRYAI